MELVKMMSRRELYQTRSRLKLENAKLAETDEPRDGVVDVLEQLKIESENSGHSRDSIDKRTASAVKAWAEEVNIALKKDFPENFDELGEHLRILEEKAQQLETNMRRSMIDVEDLDMAFDAFDTTCLNFKGDTESNATRYEAIKREGERLKKRHRDIQVERKRIAREKAEYEHELEDMKEEISAFGENVKKMCMVNAVQDVSLL